MKDFYQESFNQKKWDDTALRKCEFEASKFAACDLSNFDLSDTTFIDCSFKECNLSGVKLKNTVLRNCSFEQCKMLGLHFDHCNTFIFKVDFQNCQLNMSSFFGVSLGQTVWNSCDLREADFGSAQMQETNLSNCDLEGAIFEQTNLKSADLRMAKNFVINPNQNQIQNAKFAHDNLRGLLAHLKIDIQ